MKKYSHLFIVIFYVFIAHGILIIGENIGHCIVNFIPNNSAVLKSFNLYFGFIGHYIAFIVYFIFIKSDRFIVNDFLRGRKGNNLKDLTIGFVAGFIMNSICVGMAVVNNDIKFNINEFNVLYLLIIFFAVFIQASAEELIVRGYLFNKILIKSNKFYFAALISSLYFASIHYSIVGMDFITLFVIFLFGIFTAFSVYYFDNIWFAIAVHTAWNFNENIIFGIPISGHKASYSIFKLIYETKENSFAYNINTNLEGTLVAVAVIVAGIYLVHLCGRHCS